MRWDFLQGSDFSGFHRRYPLVFRPIVFAALSNVVPISTLLLITISYNFWHAVQLSNRIFFAFFLLLEFAFLRIIACSKRIIALWAYLFFVLVYGIIRNKNTIFVFTDFFLLAIPLMIFCVGVFIGKGGIIACEKWYKEFSKISIIILLIGAIYSVLLKQHTVPFDNATIFGVLFALFFDKKKILLSLVLSGLWAYVAAVKTFIIAFFFGVLCSISYKNLYKTFSILVLLVIIVGILLYDILHNSMLTDYAILSKIKKFVLASVMFMKYVGSSSNLDWYIDLMFAYDPSTAHRIFEVRQVFIEISRGGFWGIIFGNGLGASIDVSGTMAPFTVMSHTAEELRSARVVHIGVAWIFLKGGIVGLLVYGTIIWNLLRCGRMVLWKYQNFWIRASVYSLLYAVVSMQIQFAIPLKYVGAWIAAGICHRLSIESGKE